MDDADLPAAIRRFARRAGREIATARREYRSGQVAGALPTDDAGRVRIVCRREAEKRAVALEDGRPACYDGAHPACESCVADIDEGVVETW